MPPVSGSGCHPRREIALVRALTEAAQGRLTIISGARDDLASNAFDAMDNAARARLFREQLHATKPVRSFSAAPDREHDTFDEDVSWLLRCVVGAGLPEVLVINLTRAELGVPVVRVVIPGLEAMSEVPGYVYGARARLAQRGRDS